MNTLNTLSALSALLIEVRSNPALNAAVMRECESVYSEMFVHNETETGAEILARVGSEVQFEVIDELCRQLHSHELNKIHAINKAKESLLNPVDPTEYKEISVEDWNNQYRFNDEDEDENDWNPNDEYYSYDYDEDEYAQWDENDFKQNKPRLMLEILTTTFGTLVNYKGEPEGECVVDSDINYRTYFGKHDYS